MKKSEYYKIVSKTPQGLISMCSLKLPAYLNTRYKVHRWVEAPVGGLLVFNDYDQAFENLSYGQYQLWRVLVKEPVELPLGRYELTSECLKNPHNLINLWDYRTRCLYPWPRCSKAFKYVRLEERIK